MHPTDEIFYRGGIAELGFFRQTDELLDVVPLALEQRGVMRYGVIGAVGGGDASVLAGNGKAE